jgi:iron complex outermembrane receptor protein
MLDGAYYGGQGGESSFNTAPPPLTISDNPDYHGGHVLGRWSHAWSEDSTTHVQAYWDYKWRRYTVRERRNSFDIEVLHDWTLTRNVFLNVGTNYRYTDDDTAVQSPGIAIVPSDENLHLANAFGQLQVNLLDDKASVIVGAKLGWNDITNFEWQPTVRGIVKPWEGNAFWASVSRAERTPARSDRQLVFGPLSLGNDDLDAEVLWAFEAGYRNFMREDLTVDLSMFYNDYDDLITTQTVGPRFENDLDSESWGGEVEINWQPRDWVRFIFGYSLLLINEDYAVGALPVFGSNKKSNPRNSVVGRVQFNLPWNFELDTFVSWIDDIHAQSDANGHSIDDYWRVDLRLGWKPFDWLRLDAVGQNLNDDAHPEFGDLVGLTTYVPRTYYGKITVSY